MAEAKRENLISAAAAARGFLGVEGPALTALVTAREAAGREWLSAVTPLADTLRSTVVGLWQGYLTALNAAASTRDASLNTALTSLTGTILTAEESYSAAILSAGRRHDQAVVSAAAARDAALLDAMDAALDPAGGGFLASCSRRWKPCGPDKRR